MVDTEITKGQLKQLFEIEGALTRYGMRGLGPQLQALLNANKGRTKSHRVEPAFALWRNGQLPEFSRREAYFEDYLGTIPADELVPGRELERACPHRVLVDPRYTHEQLAGQIIKLAAGRLHPCGNLVVGDSPYWIACGFVSEDLASSLLARHNRDGDSSQVVRMMTVLEVLSWYLQRPMTAVLSTEEQRIRLMGSLGTLPDGSDFIPELVVKYPMTRLVCEETDKPSVYGICLVKRIAAKAA
ncbi:MAG: hypothetical protein WC497_00875 [Patescibacteria group bacterium]